MKKIILVIFVLFAFMANTFSQIEDFDYKPENTFGSIVKISPLSFYWGSVPLTGEYGLGLEYKAGIKSSIELKGAYVTKGILYLLIESELYEPNEPRLTMNGFRFQFDYRYYPTKKGAFKGLFVAPLFSYTTVNFSDEISKQSGYYLKVNHFEYALIAGYQFIFGRFAMEAYAGIKYRDIHWVENSYSGVSTISLDELGDFYYLNQPILPMIGISLGRAF